MGGGWEHQACVTIVSGNENGAGGQTIVVIGGQMQSDFFTNFVILWDPSTMEWENGPSLSDKRRDLVAVVCRDKVVDLVMTTTTATTTTQHWIQSRASKCLHCWKQRKHR